MADVSIDATVQNRCAHNQRSIVFTTALVGYWFYLDSDASVVYSKTTDGGATWGAAVTINSVTSGTVSSTWYDRWTPGDTGTLIHVWYFNSANDKVHWRSLDTASDTLGTEQIVFTGVSVSTGRGVFVSGTKTRSGYLYCAYDMDAGVEKGLHRSTDGGATWSASLSATFVEADLDEALLFPASNTGDDNDCWAVYLDTSALELTLKMWDSSAVAEVESAVIQVHTPNATDLIGQFGYSGSIRRSDGHLILAAVSERDTITADHQVWDINGTGSITALTSITTDIDDHYYPAVFIDQQTYAIYVAYNGKRDGTEVMDTTSKVYYTKSTDGGTTWSAGDTAYMEGAAGVVLQVWAPLMGSRFYVGWRVSGTLVGNNVNSLVLAPDALVTGTATASIDETDVVAGGKTIIITLAGTTWIP